MKVLMIIMVLVSILVCGAMAADFERTGKLAKVTVYPHHAAVTRTVNLQLETGSQTLRIPNLSQQLDMNSIRVGASGPAPMVINAVDVVTRHTDPKQPEKIRELKDRRRDLNRQIAGIDQEITVSKSRQEYFESVRVKSIDETKNAISGVKVTVDDYRRMEQYVFAGLAGSIEAERTARYRKRELKDEVERINKQLDQMQSGDSTQSTDVLIDLTAKQSGRYMVALEYFLPDASWYPVYDSRLDPKTGKLELTCGAYVSQKTGEDWTDVTLSLSTVRTSSKMSAPEINAWILQPSRVQGTMPAFEETVVVTDMSGGITGSGIVSLHGGEETANLYLFDGVETEDPVVLVTQVGANVDFSVPGKTTVRSDGSLKRVVIANHEFDAELKYRCTPKLDTTAYLAAHMENTSGAPLLPGEIRSYLSNEFIGTGQMPMTAKGDSLDMPFGADDRIRVERITVNKDRLGEKVFSDKVRWAFKYEITMENLQEYPVTLVIRDHMPVSHDQRIKISEKVLQPEPKEEKDNGTLTWEITVAPSQKSSILMSYQLEHTENVTLLG